MGEAESKTPIEASTSAPPFEAPPAALREPCTVVLPIRQTVRLFAVLSLLYFDIVQPLLFPFISLAVFLYVFDTAKGNGYEIGSEQLPAHQYRARKAFFDGCLHGQIFYAVWLVCVQFLVRMHGPSGEFQFIITSIIVGIAVTYHMLYLRSGWQEWQYLLGGPWRKSMQLMGVFVKLTRDEISLLVDFVAASQANEEHLDVELGKAAPICERYTLFVPSVATFGFLYLLAMLAAVEDHIPLGFTRIATVSYVFYVFRCNGYYALETATSKTEYRIRKAGEVGAYLGALGSVAWGLYLMYRVDWNSSYKPGIFAIAPAQAVLSAGFAALLILCLGGRDDMKHAVDEARRKTADLWNFMDKVKRREASFAFHLQRNNS